MELQDRIEFKNGKAALKRTGSIPIYGGNGILGYTDEWNYEDVIVVGRVGAYCGSVHIAKGKCWVSDNAIAGVPKNSSEIEFWYFFLKELGLNKKQIGSSQPLITQGILNGIEISTPKGNIEDKAKVLSDLDAKIELNNKINAELEAMAKLIYDYWFVQFDFPCLPSDYVPKGQVNPNDKKAAEDLRQRIATNSTYKQVGGLPVPDGKKWFVYVLLCDDGSFYKGITNDLYRRYYEHSTGQGAEWTKVHKPRRVIHFEEFETKEAAAAREKELKTGFGRTWLTREYEKLQKTRNKPGSPAHQSRLMPAGEMVFNAELKREIPKGWEVKKLNDLSAYISRGISPKYIDEGGSCVINQKCVREGTILFDQTRRNDESKRSSANKRVELYDVLVNSTGVGTLGRVSLVRRLPEEEMTVDSHVTIVRADTDKINQFYFGYSLLQKQMEIERFSLGSTGQVELSRAQLESVNIIIPDKKQQQKFEDFYKNICEQVANNEQQNQHLSSLRDWLLPMLMNGQVRVG